MNITSFRAFFYLQILIGIPATFLTQPIPRYFFSQNAWMSDTLGNIADCKGAPKGLNCKLWGKIHYNNNWQKVKESGVRLIRFGGEHADENMPTRRQYLQMIDSARSKGIDVILQVPYNNNYYTCDTAAALVKFINVTMKRNVKYWGIGNEPDLSPPNGYGYYTASPVADYTKQFAVKMKAVDSTIITMGPELTYYDDNNRLFSELTTPGGYYDITGKVPGHTYYYLDIITFHSYPYGGQQTRAEIISNLRDPWHISHMLDLLKGKLDSCNTFHNRGKNALKIALTETNLNYRNSTDPELNAHSFLAGQFWCELMAVGMEKGVEFLSFWCVVENSLGYISEKDGKLWPTYYHYKLITDNFKGTYYKTEIGKNDLKSFVAADSIYISVMLMNQQNKGSHFKFSLQMGQGRVKGESGVAVKIKDLPLTGTLIYNDKIEDESTLVLVFDHGGKLLKKIQYKKSDGPNAVPKLVRDGNEPLYISVGGELLVPADKDLVMTAGPENKKASYTWYEENSQTPLSVKPSRVFKVSPKKNTRYKLLTTYEGCEVEQEVNVKVLPK